MKQGDILLAESLKTMTGPKSRDRRVAIVGAGPAGIAAAIQLKRAGFMPVIFEKGTVGGLLNEASWVDNYPGLGKRIKAMKLRDNFKKELERFLIVPIRACVASLRRVGSDFELLCRSHRSRYPIAIIASGTEPQALPECEHGLRVISEARSVRNVRRRLIGIIGGGDAAFDYALDLARQNRVTVLFRGAQPKALPLLVKQARASNCISIRANARVTAIRCLRNGAVVELQNSAGKEQKIVFDYVVMAVGRRPALGFLTPSLRRTFPSGIPGRLYFAGDVRGGRFRQAAIAVGDGIKVAMQIAVHVNRSRL